MEITLCLAVFALLVLAIYDIGQKKHTILHNFPVIGYIRYFLEKIGPEMRQYWVANDKEELPFSRDERTWIYLTAKKMNNAFGFGTSEQLYTTGYPIIKQSTFPFPEEKAALLSNDSSLIPCTKVIGELRGRKRPYRPLSIVNISAMSFGSLGAKAVSAINMGAKIARCYHNTGEGGVSPYHLKGADVVWQLGTGYFGALDEQGHFSLAHIQQKVLENPQIRAIEIKLSQGAKPGKGGILPAKKVTAEIAEIRKVKAGKICISPNNHRQFSSPKTLIDFVEKIARATGLPVGIKSAIGQIEFWKELAVEMKAGNKGPDFITVDGGEGGTGAAPLTFSDHVSLPFKVGFKRVYQVFLQENMADQVVWIGSAKLGFPDRAIVALAMGCDLINIAREAMISIGCIQAQKCHTDHCPTGVATQNKWLQAGLSIPHKSQRLANYLQGFRHELLSLAHAAGYEHPSQFTADDIEFSTGVNQFSTLAETMGYRKIPTSFVKMQDLRETA